MAWPGSDVNTTNTDAGTDSPAADRADILDLKVKFNQIRNHVSTFMQGLLAAADAAASRVILGTREAAQVQEGVSFTTTGTGSAYVLTAAPALASYAGQELSVTFHAASSGAAPTINVNGLGALTLYQLSPSGALNQIGTSLPAGWRSRVRFSAGQAVVLDNPPPAFATWVSCSALNVTFTADLSGTPNLAVGATAGTSGFTAPKKGHVRVNASNCYYIVNSGTVTACEIYVTVNGTSVGAVHRPVLGATVQFGASISVVVAVNAGDVVTLRGSVTGTSPNANIYATNLNAQMVY